MHYDLEVVNCVRIVPIVMDETTLAVIRDSVNHSNGLYVTGKRI